MFRIDRKLYPYKKQEWQIHIRQDKLTVLLQNNYSELPRLSRCSGVVFCAK